MNKKLLSLYSLKFNPFSAEVPASALCNTASIQSFCWRIEQQIGEGGFALAIGDPGTGKSAALRILVERLGNLADVMVGVLTRPQAAIADLYRELGHLFSVPWHLTTDGPAPKFYAKNGCITLKTLCIGRCC
jgi:general secretion pathway protein A